jgi:hypothetical protein
MSVDQCFGSGDPDLIRIQSGQWIHIRIQIQEGKNDPQKYKKIKRFSCFEVLDVLFLRAEGFFCVLDVLYRGLGIGKLQFLIKKNI